ncbi:hypothetical protein B0H67DRAFT_149712 [Lasiosphaeris hirsuta]|uniref:Uncharacterized protein n=1 Tax=Lasiosphaeris hirsuta TaxID=260670 RepID=A0AA40ANV1_9PEZI|nr:hypothetical protein B0H67DRAFT_149712 [Lasiosphaeris hirsuta]
MFGLLARIITRLTRARGRRQRRPSINDSDSSRNSTHATVRTNTASTAWTATANPMASTKKQPVKDVVHQNVTSRYLKKDTLQELLEQLFPGQKDFNIRVRLARPAEQTHTASHAAHRMVRIYQVGLADGKPCRADEGRPVVFLRAAESGRL